MKKVGYLGPEGSYSQIALEKYIAPSDQAIPLESFYSLFDALKTGLCDEIIIPLENSIEGFVSTNLDLLEQETHAITQEIIVPIEHCLLTQSGETEAHLRIIASHPQALAQCARTIRTRFPLAKTLPTLSTSAAIEHLKPGTAAIGSERLAKLNNLTILAKNIGDFHNNFTRFVVVSQAKTVPTGHDKTSIVFQAKRDQPGILHQILGEFATRNINLTKITSRPTKHTLGDYIFFVDFEGHSDDKLVQDVLAAIKQKSSHLKWLGSYKQYD